MTTNGDDTLLTPPDPAAQEHTRARRRRRRSVLTVAAVVVAVMVAGQLAFGWVGRIIDATGWTCGGDWERIDADELDAMRIVRWGTPQVADVGLDPADFTDLPPALLAPTLSAYPNRDTGQYDPLLYPLGDGAVLQGAGYEERTWVAVDAETGEPWWGIAEQATGYSTMQGRFMLVAARDDGRTDLTTFAAQTGEVLSCVRLDGTVTAMAGVGDQDLAVALQGEVGEDGPAGDATLLRLDPTTGTVVWSRSIEQAARAVQADGEVVLVSTGAVDATLEVFDYVSRADGLEVAAFAAADGAERWRLDVDGEQRRHAIATVSGPDGESNALLLTVDSREAWDRDEVRYTLVDDSGTELWSVVGSAPHEAGAWQAEDVLVLPDEQGSFALDIASGDRIWGEGPFLAGGAVVVGEELIAPGQLDDGDQVTDVVVVATGATSRYDLPLFDAVASDTYLVADAGPAQIVLPLAQ